MFVMAKTLDIGSIWQKFVTANIAKRNYFINAKIKIKIQCYINTGPLKKCTNTSSPTWARSYFHFPFLAPICSIEASKFTYDLRGAWRVSDLPLTTPLYASETGAACTQKVLLLSTVPSESILDLVGQQSNTPNPQWDLPAFTNPWKPLPASQMLLAEGRCIYCGSLQGLNLANK